MDQRDRKIFGLRLATQPEMFCMLQVFRFLVCLVLLVIFSSELAVACIQFSGFDQLINLPATIMGKPSPAQDRQLRALIARTDRSEVIMAANRIGGQALSTQSLQYLQRLERADDPVAYALSDGSRQFLDAFARELDAYCNVLGRSSAESVTGGRGRYRVTSFLNTSVTLRDLQGSYAVLATIALGFVGLLTGVYSIDFARRRIRSRRGKRVSCEVPAQVSFLDHTFEGSVTVLGRKGFRFRFGEPAGPPLLEEIGGDLICYLSVDERPFGCRIFFCDAGSARFLFLQDLTEFEYDAIAEASVTEPRPINLTAEERRRMDRAQARPKTG
jgi:hypothetical protein